MVVVRRFQWDEEEDRGISLVTPGISLVIITKDHTAFDETGILCAELEEEE